MKKLIALLLAMVLCLGLFAGCGDNEEKSDLAKAKEYLYSLYVDKSTVTATDLEYPARVKGGSTFFDVEWTVAIVSGAGEIKVVESENEGFIVVDVPGEPAEDIVYKLTATIKSADGKESEQLVYEYTVPKFTLTSFDEYVAAAAGETLVTQGVVTGLISKSQGASYNCVYYQDADGGYYAYNMNEDPVTDLKLEVGMTIRVTGEKDIYSGTHEVKNASVEIVSNEKSDVVATDFTDRYKNAAALTDEALVYQQSLLVTVKGVEITGQDASNGYYKFKLGELESYIRISGSTCPLNADEKAALIAGHTEHTGWIANVTGVICVFNGAFYLTPVSVDAFEYLSLAEKSDEEMVEYEKGNLGFSSSVSQDTEIELPATGVTYDKVAITWAVEGEGAAIVDGKLVLTVGANDSVVTVTATLTAGEATGSVSFEIKIRGNATDTTISKVDTITNGDKVVIYFPDSGLAISGEASGNKIAGVEAILDGTTLTAPDAAYIDVVVDENGYYTFMLDGKYLTAGETGNSLVWADEASDYSLWILETAENGYYIKNVNAAYNGNPQYLEYYNNFTTYGFSDPAKANIYTFQFFAVTEESGNTAGDGSNVMIYYPDSDLYITGTADGMKLAGGAEAEAAVWTISVDENGYYTFMLDGKYLTSGETGNSLTLADAPSDYSLWELTILDDGSCYIRNVNAAYNGNANQYLEYYNGFTTYGFNESKVNIYTFVLIVV